MFVYLVNVKEGVHRDWECGAPAPYFYSFTHSDCTLSIDMSSDTVHPLKSILFSQPKMHLLALLGPFADLNDRFIEPFLVKAN